MPDELLARIGPTVAEIVGFAGMELVHLELRREGAGLVLRLFIDKNGGVTLDDCARISRLVSSQLDADDPIPNRYTLEVSSPGIDRPLVRDQDYSRFTGHFIRLTTAAPLEGQRRFSGRLIGLADGNVRLALEDGREVAIPREQVAMARLADDAFDKTPGARGRRA
jgi:ribosome maturation factor RimP